MVREARAAGGIYHVGRVFDICIEKGSELEESGPARKFTGRAAFQGNHVRDENWDVALFRDLSSSPATMEAAKMADLYAALPGNSGKQADAEQAYTQAKLGGVPMYVDPPAARTLA